MPYLKDIINDLKESDAWEIGLTITIHFISPKGDNDEERVMHSKSDNVEIMINGEADEIIEKLFNLLKADIKIFYNIHLLCNKCHKINLWCGQSYIDSPYWIKNKKATINPIN